jgi:hypothetical protein
MRKGFRSIERALEALSKMPAKRIIWLLASGILPYGKFNFLIRKFEDISDFYVAIAAPDGIAASVGRISEA